jgi:hypothetical protein
MDKHSFAMPWLHQEGSDQFFLLAQVIVSYSDQFTNSLRQAGLNVTRLTITGPLPCPNETVADQVLHQLGPPSTWQQLRQVTAAYMHVVLLQLPLRHCAWNTL